MALGRVYGVWMWVMESGMNIGKVWVLGMAGGVWGLCSFLVRMGVWS